MPVENLVSDSLYNTEKTYKDREKNMQTSNKATSFKKKNMSSKLIIWRRK